MKTFPTILALLVAAASAGPAVAQADGTPMQQAAQKLMHDLSDALPKSSLDSALQQTLTADASTLIKAADARADGHMPDRSATKAAARELNDAFHATGFQANDAQTLIQDLEGFKASAR